MRRDAPFTVPVPLEDFIGQYDRRVRRVKAAGPFLFKGIL